MTHCSIDQLRIRHDVAEHSKMTTSRFSRNAHESYEHFRDKLATEVQNENSCASLSVVHQQHYRRPGQQATWRVAQFERFEPLITLHLIL